jgi:MFS family permease
LGITFFVLGLGILSVVSNLVVLLIVAAVSSFGFAIQFVVYNTLISINASESAQGGTLGVAWAIAGAAQSIAPVLAASAFSFGASVGFVGLAFLVSALIGLATIPLVLVFKKAVG